MNVLITGASGFIGSAAGKALTGAGHRVIPLRRQAPATPRNGQAVWDPSAAFVDLSQAGAIDAVIHLAGENIAQRWTPTAKQRITRSRVDATRLLCQALTRLPKPPQVLLSASAIGIYGDRGDEVVNEFSAPGSDFLAQLAQRWEAATEDAESANIRVVHLRFGLVMAPDGGALAKLLPPFKLGAGGRVGSGQQYWSWIALEDVVRTIGFVLENSELRGPLNVSSPNPVRNVEFARALGRALHRPAVLPVPQAAIRLLFGEMGKSTMLASCRVQPLRLQETGFVFAAPELAGALRQMLA